MTLTAGDLMELRGANGSGKTTLLRCVAGLLTEDAGAVRVRAGARPLYLGHKPGVNPMLSPFENIRWYVAREGQAFDPGQCEAALEAVGLGVATHVPCATLSAGQKRRAALARLLVTSAPLWLLDEPFTALDPAGRELVRTLIVRRRTEHGAVVCATHESTGLTGARTMELGT